MSVVDSIYHKKHFYKVTWERSDTLLREVPWLKAERQEFCMIGYREPTHEEAEAFIGMVMYDRLFDRVCGVEEISKEEALRDFEMEDWRYQKAFAYDEFHKGIDAILHNAIIRSELSVGKNVASRDYIKD